MASPHAVFAFHGPVAAAYETGLCDTPDVGIIRWGQDHLPAESRTRTGTCAHNFHELFLPV